MPKESPDRTLIDAARDYARKVAGLPLQRICLTLGDGSKRKIEVMCAIESDWPPEEGWAVRGNEGAYCGVNFQLRGKSLSVFRVLVEVGKDGIGTAELKTKVWDFHTDDRTVQNAVSRLRKDLRDALGLDEVQEVIGAEGDLYWLAEIR